MSREVGVELIDHRVAALRFVSFRSSVVVWDVGISIWRV